MHANLSAAFIAAVFVVAYPALRLHRWNKRRIVRNRVEAVINRGLRLYLPGPSRVEWVGGVRCLVTLPPVMTLETTVPADDVHRAATRHLHQLWGAK